MTIPKFTSAQAARLRFQAQGLVERVGDTPLEVASHMLAMQGQDFPMVQWALGVRSGASRADVHAAFDAGELVRSWPMRGTLHVIAAADLPWMQAMTREYAFGGVQRRWEHLGIDEAWCEQAAQVARDALKGKRSGLTRAEMVAELDNAGLEASKQRGYHAIWYMSQIGTTVWGPMRGDEQELVLVDRWIKKPRKLAREDALGEAITRYASARGPVTSKDFAWWAGLPMRDVTIALEVAGDALVQVDVDDTAMWMSAEAAGTLDPDDAATKATVLALPGFDEYLLGYQNRDAQLPKEHAQQVCPGNNGIFRSMIVDGADVTGTWVRTKRAKGVIVTEEPFTKLPARAVKGFRASAADYAEFVETTLL